MLPKKLFVIDAMALAHRCFWAYPDLSTQAGRKTGVVYGSSKFLTDLITYAQPDYLLAATDPGGKNFRHEIYPDYKATRKEKDAALVEQLPDFYTLFEKMDIPMIKMPGYEADDVIGSIAKQWASPELQVFIVSADKDFMQCVNQNVFLWIPGKHGGPPTIVDTIKVVEKFGVGPSQVVDVLALLGDSADNIPGVKGIGPKKAAPLVKSMGSVEAVYENIHMISGKTALQKLINGKESALLSKSLATIKTDLELPYTLEEVKYELSPMADKLKDFYKELEFQASE